MRAYACDSVEADRLAACSKASSRAIRSSASWISCSSRARFTSRRASISRANSYCSTNCRSVDRIVGVAETSAYRDPECRCAASLKALTESALRRRLRSRTKSNNVTAATAAADVHVSGEKAASNILVVLLRALTNTRNEVYGFGALGGVVGDSNARCAASYTSFSGTPEVSATLRQTSNSGEKLGSCPAIHPSFPAIGPQ